MKSKISFINRTMLQKNVKSFTGQSGHCMQWCYYSTVRFPYGADLRMQEFIYGKNWHKYMLDIISRPISAWRRI